MSYRFPASDTGKALLSATDAKAARDAILAVSDLDPRLDDNRTPVDGSVTSEKIDPATLSALAIPADGSVTSAKLDPTFSGTLVTKTGTETLTNKTLTNPLLSTPRLTSINDNTGALVAGIAGGENYFNIFGTASGGNPGIYVQGTTDANVGINIQPKGNGKIFLRSDTGNTPTLSAAGPDASLDLDLLSKGSGAVKVNGVAVVDVSSTQTLTNKTLTTPVLTNPAITGGKLNNIYDSSGNLVMGLIGAASPNYATIMSAATGSTPQISLGGVDANVGLNLVTKGTGKFTIYTPSGETPSIVGSGAGATHGLSLTTKGGGLVQVNGDTVVTATATQTLSNKFFTGITSFGLNAETQMWVMLNSAAGNYRNLQYQTAGSARWNVRCTNEAESGSNAGSNYEIAPRTDANVALPVALRIERATGNSTFSSIVSANSFVPSKTSTATAAGTTTLTIASSQVQEFTGSTTQTVKLPTTGVTAGMSYTIINLSTGAVTVQSSGGNGILVQATNRIATFTARIDTPTAAADWQHTGTPISASAGTNSVAMRDASGNILADNFIKTKTATATAAGITTLTMDSTAIQEFTGATTQTVKLPTTGVTAGQQYTVVNNSSGSVTVQSSGANTVATVTAATLQLFVAQIDTPTAAAHWRAI